jgi:hypothetical protein
MTKNVNKQNKQEIESFCFLENFAIKRSKKEGRVKINKNKKNTTSTD